jgi:hypothetical protein
MRPPVWFVDTSVLMNVLDVPGYAQDRGHVLSVQQDRREQGDTFILPVAAVVESGNHITRLKNGHDRRQAADRFSKLLMLVATGQAPWRLYSSAWDGGFLGRLAAGGMTGSSLVEHAVRGLGCGDLSILVEREMYRERTGISDVRVWTLDALLDSYA